MHLRQIEFLHSKTFCHSGFSKKWILGSGKNYVSYYYIINNLFLGCSYVPEEKTKTFGCFTVRKVKSQQITAFISVNEIEIYLNGFVTSAYLISVLNSSVKLGTKRLLIK